MTSRCDRRENRARHLALVDAPKLEDHDAFEVEHSELMLIQGALEGLKDLEAGFVLDEAARPRHFSELTFNLA